MILSIIVISHNQKEGLKRCLDSIIAQNIPFKYEIIISDDNSNDGTWELAQGYASNYEIIRAYQCNTDDYNPANNSTRSGWNRCNGYQYATGKYISHVDGDDFFIKGTEIYRKQIELLEKHPDCSCCMANDYELDDGKEESEKKLIHQEIVSTGQILESEEYIRNYFRESHCFVYRRDVTFNPKELYGGFYVDTIITDHHLQYGNIVCLNDAGYVYVKYKNSIWNTNLSTKDYLAFAQALYVSLLIPKWQHAFLSERKHIKGIMYALKLVISNYYLKESNYNWVRNFDRFVYKSFNRKHSVIDVLHLYLLFVVLGLIYLFKPRSRIVSNCLNRIL